MKRVPDTRRSESGSAGFVTQAVLGAGEFAWICQFLYQRTGILLVDGKQALVTGRLDKRLRKYGLSSYGTYFERLGLPGNEQEIQTVIDLLTTNETYFFREPAHFDFIQQHVLRSWSPTRRMRVWSAASSSGEEAYSVAMLLAEHCPSKQWEIVGTDISTRVIEKARYGLYPLMAAEKIPKTFLKKYCLKGREEYQDFFLINSELRSRVHFHVLNLLEMWPADIGNFDIIFLRNVMIYFDVPTKQRLLKRLAERLLPGGYFVVSHSESLNGLSTELSLVRSSVYCKPL